MKEGREEGGGRKGGGREAGRREVGKEMGERQEQGTEKEVG